MVSVGEQISSDEHQIAKILISIICLYGNDGLPLVDVEKEFLNYCGCTIPWKQFGAHNLKSWLITLPHIYIVKNHFEQEVLIEQSPKSMHIKDLVVKQKHAHYRHKPVRSNSMKRKAHIEHHFDDGGYNQPYKMKKRLECENLPEGSFIHTSINNMSATEQHRYEKFEELVS